MKFKQGERVKIVGISLWRRLVGLKDYDGNRRRPPTWGIVRGYREDMVAWEVWSPNINQRVSTNLTEQWFFVEEKLRREP